MSLFQQQEPLGLLFKNENTTEDMIEILDHIHKYVPVENIVRYCVIFYNGYFVNTWNTNETSVEFSYGSVFVIKFVLFIF